MLKFCLNFLLLQRHHQLDRQKRRPLSKRSKDFPTCSCWTLRVKEATIKKRKQDLMFKIKKKNLACTVGSQQTAAPVVSAFKCFTAVHSHLQLSHSSAGPGFSPGGKKWYKGGVGGAYLGAGGCNPCRETWICREGSRKLFPLSRNPAAAWWWWTESLSRVWKVLYKVLYEVTSRRLKTWSEQKQTLTQWCWFNKAVCGVKIFLDLFYWKYNHQSKLWDSWRKAINIKLISVTCPENMTCEMQMMS